jgi:methionine biosynthesis protein MetW
MKNNISQGQKEFYEDYWKNRISQERIHTKEDMWVPQRISITVDMVVKDKRYGNNERISVLDIGCGEGTMGKLLKEHLGNKVSIVGCDISNTALKNAVIYYSNVHEIDIETNGIIERFYKQKFDYVIVLEVLEHLFKPENVLKQVYTILNEDGILIASFPNIAWYKYRIDMLRGNFPKNYLLYPGEHIQYFTFRSFYKLLRESKFSPIEIDGQFVFPSIFKPARFYYPILKLFPNLFGYQIVIKSQKEKRKTS